MAELINLLTIYIVSNLFFTIQKNMTVRMAMNEGGRKLLVVVVGGGRLRSILRTVHNVMGSKALDTLWIRILGYRLTYQGYDILALHTFVARGTITTVGFISIRKGVPNACQEHGR